VTDTTAVGDRDVDSWDELWGAVNANYALFAIENAERWDALYFEVLDAMAEQPSQTMAHWQMSKALQTLEDGHVGAFFFDTLCDVDVLGSGFAMVGQVEAVSSVGACAVGAGESAYVSAVSEFGGSALELGDEIIAVDGRELSLVLKDLAAQPRCFARHATKDGLRAQLMQQVLLRDQGDQTITVRRAGALVDVPVVLTDTLLDCSRPYPALYGQDADAFRSFGQGIVAGPGPRGSHYVTLDAFGDDPSAAAVATFVTSLKTAIEPANDSAALVIDLRGNTGGDLRILNALASWLIDAPVTYLTQARKEGAAVGVVGEASPMTIEPDPTFHVAVPTALLIDPVGISAVDFIAEAIKVSGAALLVGEPAAGGFGGGQVVDTVGALLVVNPLLVRDLSGAAREGAPTPVDVEVVLDGASIAAGQDAVWSAALDALLGP
jgi:C-terminal processing protease CtpA/Prc